MLKSKGHRDRAQVVRCWISPNYSIVEEQFNVAGHRLEQCLSYTSVTCTVSDMASSMISVKGEGKEGVPLSMPSTCFLNTQENQITFFIPAAELLPGMGTCSVVPWAWPPWWQTGPEMPWRANLTSLKSFASKLGSRHTGCAGVKLALKEAVRRDQCLHTDLQNKSVYVPGLWIIWDLLELLQAHRPPVRCIEPIPKHLVRQLLLVNLQGQSCCWQGANMNRLTGDQSDGSSEAARESSGNKVGTLAAFKYFLWNTNGSWDTHLCSSDLTSVLLNAQICCFCHQERAFFFPISLNPSQHFTRNNFLQTVVKWTYFNFHFCQDISVTFVCFT